MKTCVHLNRGSNEYFVWFTGNGTEHHWVCGACSQQHPIPPAEWIDADSEVIKKFERMWTCDGVVGTPESKRRSSGLRFSHTDFSSPTAQSVLDIQPSGTNLWVVLFSSGQIQFIDIELGHIHREIVIDSPFPLDEEVVLRMSNRGDFFAVFQASGQHGIVIDILSGMVTARLDRGDYRSENSFFPIAFFDNGGQTKLIVATNWNRLDVIDPATGNVLTPRTIPENQTGQPQPPHDLDYFHAQLTVCPDHSWIADYGWYWHPLGIIRAWNVRDWLMNNVWESEDGESLKEVAIRDYYWDGPVCWIDSRTLAVWGWGSDADCLVPAISLFDVTTGNLLRWFAGPHCRKASVWPPKKAPQSLFFDEFLFSVSEEEGTSVWDIATGERLLSEPELIPLHYHPVNREFVSRTSDGWRLSRLVK